MPVGLCRLCRKLAELRESHFMPAALYRSSNNSRMSFATTTRSGILRQQIKTHLLCDSCEQRFNINGEKEVLKWIAPKSESFPLYEKMASVLPRDCDEQTYGFSGQDLGVDMDKFAYFTLSVVWRAAVKQWRLPDGKMSALL